MKQFTLVVLSALVGFLAFGLTHEVLILNAPTDNLNPLWPAGEFIISAALGWTVGLTTFKYLNK